MCLAMKRDLSGRLVAIRLKVGCAWAVNKGLAGRRTSHENDNNSKGYLFHQFIQSTKDDHEVTLELRWHTLAVGDPFVRKTQADEYKAARYYQIEAMLASALGALHEDCGDWKFHAMQWWAFEPDDTNVPWLGADGRCSLEDVWADRPDIRSEEQEAERAAAIKIYDSIRHRKTRVTNVATDRYLCTHDECKRSVTNQPLRVLNNH
ncbi:hypothetical protein KCU65_g8318, partial [Aureobasidium melanogenum]